MSRPWEFERVVTMRKVTRLVPFERTEIDARRVLALVRDMGHPSAERLIGRALDEIDDRLQAVDRAVCRGDLRGAAQRARQLATVADAAGLTGVTHVARMVADAAEAGDGPALGATLSRLSRLADGAVCAIGEAWAARL
jgi:HPt (histidine-containing phosphotransfer) domain-containing protein